MLIDAHQHFWQLNRFDYSWLHAPELASICRDYLPADLAPHLQQCGVEKSIFVQTRHETAENDWVLELAEQHPFLVGVVGWVDLRSPSVEEDVIRYRQHPKFIGVRHVVQDEPDPNWVIHPDTLRGLGVLEQHGLPFDMLFYAHHLPHAATLAEKFPQLTLVLNHLSKPDIKNRAMNPWREHFRRAASFPNVVCKLSGMVTEADRQRWCADDLRPFVDEALEAFGPQRLLFGSDWPVCELAGSYEQVFNALSECLDGLNEADLDAIFGGNAASIYQLRF
jgi:L-fuconolactonase